MMPEAHVVHAVPGRLRIKIPAMRGDAAYFQQIQQRLADHPQVDGLVVNVDTGSILVGHSWKSEHELAALGREEHLFELRPAAFDPLWQRASAGLEQLDRRMAAFTRGELGMRSTLLVGLVGLAVRQAMKGQVMAPSITLLWYALQLIGVPFEQASPARAREELEQEVSHVKRASGR